MGLVSSACQVLNMPFEVARHLPSARIYAAHHINLNRLGHAVQYPVVMAARRMLDNRSTAELIQSAKTAPMEGVLNLD